MKNLLFVAITFIALNLTAQNKEIRYGVSLGILNSNYTAEFNNVTTDENEVEFYGGFNLEFYLEENFSILSEVLYFKTEVNDRLSIPILGRYNVAKNLSLLFGPQLFFELEDTPPDFNAINIGLSAGISFDVDKNFSIQSRYSRQINNSYNGDLDITSNTHYINFGFAFKMN